MNPSIHLFSIQTDLESFKPLKPSISAIKKKTEQE